MPRVSGTAKTALLALRAAGDDATTAQALAGRALAILQQALRFDEGVVLAVDDQALLVSQLLAYRGDGFPGFVRWLRDGYLALVPREHEWATIPGTLRSADGVLLLHAVRADNRAAVAGVPEIPRAQLAKVRRALGVGGGTLLRWGMSHRGRWVGVLQMEWWHEPDAVNASALDLVARAVPRLARGLDERRAIPAPSASGRRPPARVPPPGHMLFDARRTLVSRDAAAAAWIARLPEDGVAAHGLDIPVAVRSVVGAVDRYGQDRVVVRLADAAGHRVVVVGSRLAAVREATRGTRRLHQTLVTIAGTASESHEALVQLTRRQRQVARAVARGLSDDGIARRLAIAPSTVHDHIKALHAVTGLRSRAALAAGLARWLPPD